MSKVFIEESTLSSIGNAIREKTGKSELISPGNMPTEISSITTGSGGTGGDDVVKQLLDGSFAGEYVDNDITTFKNGAFMNTKVTKIDCPNATRLPWNFVRECSDLVQVNLPKVTNGDSSDYAFYYCNKLQTLNLPLLKTAKTYTFSNYGLESINLPALTIASMSFCNATKLTNINVPLLDIVGSGTFEGCSSLEEITLPSLRYTNGGTSFQYCGKLKKVDLPIFGDINGITSSLDKNRYGQIMVNMFAYCRSLDTLILRHSLRIVTLGNTNAFTNTPIASGTGYIYVPAELIDEYKTATNWVTFADQFRAIEDYPEICGEVAE